MVSNIQPVITNRVIIMNLVLEVRNKYQDNIMVPRGKISQCLGECLVIKVWYIRVSDSDKVFNTFTVITFLSLTNFIFTLKFNYIGKDVFQSFPLMITCQRNIVARIGNRTKVFKSYWPSKLLTHSIGVRYWALPLRNFCQH